MKRYAEYEEEITVLRKRIAELEAEVNELKKSLLKTGKVYSSVEEMQKARTTNTQTGDAGK